MQAAWGVDPECTTSIYTINYCSVHIFRRKIAYAFPDYLSISLRHIQQTISESDAFCKRRRNKWVGVNRLTEARGEVASEQIGVKQDEQRRTMD
jgi:hypothetical protein